MIKGLVVVLAPVAALAPTSATWVEHAYSRRIYLVVQNQLTPLVNHSQLALFDPLVLVLVAGLAAWWIKGLKRTPSGRRWRAVPGLVVDTLVFSAALYLMFLLLWGLNYRRQPLEEKVDFDRARVTRNALVALARESVSRMNELHAPAHEGAWPELSGVRPVLTPAFFILQRRLGMERVAAPGEPKWSLLSLYFRRSAIDGMTDPFFLEAIINDDVLPFERPFVVAHEWAHLAGYADEAEANLVGWLTCLHGDVRARYSGWLFLYPQLSQSLAPAERREVAREIQPGPRRDLEAIHQRLRRATPIVRLIAERSYDRFLKANRVREGVASYDQVVTLVLGTRFEREWVPAMKERD